MPTLSGNDDERRHASFAGAPSPNLQSQVCNFPSRRNISMRTGVSRIPCILVLEPPMVRYMIRSLVILDVRVPVYRPLILLHRMYVYITSSSFVILTLVLTATSR